MDTLAKYNRIDVDFALGCPGTRDTNCDIWDYIVGVTACCTDGSPCFEIGRWITPFRRRVGRWLTPIRQYLPLFADKTCIITAATVGYTHWHATLNMRFSDPLPSVLIPRGIMPLFVGGTFNHYYNQHFYTISFMTPNPIFPKKVELFAVISGHGSNSEGCAEFCVTSHHFVINNNFNNVTYNEAGTQLGCAMKVLEGSVPNEHGTWVYGRDGWCDGQNVRPWVVDVTDQILWVGDHKENMLVDSPINQVTYFGWFNGGDPKATDDSGSIFMYSWLVFYYDQ